MTLNDRVLVILERWEELREKGETVAPEELCKNCPDLLKEVTKCIEDMALVPEPIPSGNQENQSGKGDSSHLFDNSLGGPNLPPPSGMRYDQFVFHDAGGLGVVYKARDIELGRQVALKRLNTKVGGNAENRRRFLREAEVTARLEHPGIVPVYGLVRDAGGQPCYAMRFIKGESLNTAIQQFHTKRDGRAGSHMSSGEEVLEFRKLLNHFVTACNTIAYAHSRGVVHRDIKPANIMLGPYGETLVVDWGLAKVMGKGESSDVNHAGDHDIPLLETQLASHTPDDLTRAGHSMGTPAFMSPEQAAGRLESIGPASDIYSLGATLYCVLTGKSPFSESDRAVILQKVLKSEFTPPTSRNRNVPAALEAICVKAMAFKPEHRYTSAEALAEDIEHWLADEAVSARREPLAVRFARWVRQHKPLSVSIAAACILALTIAITFREAQLIENLKTEKYFHHIARVQAGWREGDFTGAEALLDECRLKDRAWEWRFLKGMCHRELRILDGYSDSVVSLDFNSDGTRLASGSLDGSVRICEVASGKVVFESKQEDEIWCVKFSPDGMGLAWGGTDQIRIRDENDGQIHGWIAHKGGYVRALVFSPDGTQIVSGSDSGSGVFLWNARTGKEIRRWDPFLTRAIAISADGKQVVAGGYAKKMKIWDVATNGQARELPDQGTRIMALAFSPNARHLACGGEDGSVSVWNEQGTAPVWTLRAHASDVTALVFSPDGKQLVSSSYDGTARFYDAEKGEEIRILKGHQGGVRALAFSPNGTMVATGGVDRTVRIWDAKASQDAATITVNEMVPSIAYNFDGSKLVSTTTNGKVAEWDSVSRQELFAFAPKKEFSRFEAVAFAPDGNLAYCDGESICLCDAKTGQLVQRLNEPTGFVRKLAFSPDGKILVAHSGKILRIWRILEKASPLIAEFPMRWGTCLAFSPDSTRIVAATDDGMKIFSAITGEHVPGALNDQSGPVFGVAYSKDSSMLASGGAQGTIKLWDAASGRVRWNANGHSSMVWSVAFSPDGKRLVSAGGDHLIKIWDVVTGLNLLTLHGHRSEVPCVVFSPDGNQLVSCGGEGDGTIRIWDADLTPKRRFERQAVDLLSFLFSKPLRKLDVLDFIQNSGTVSPEVVKVALAHVRRFEEDKDPDRYYQSSWTTVRHRYLNSIQYLFAMQQAKTALSMVPSNEKYRTALAMAQYRLGRYQDAVIALAQAHNFDQESLPNLAIAAMAHYKLGEKDLATATLARLHDSMKNGESSKKETAEALFQEAQELIQTKSKAP